MPYFNITKHKYLSWHLMNNKDNSLESTCVPNGKYPALPWSVRFAITRIICVSAMEKSSWMRSRRMYHGCGTQCRIRGITQVRIGARDRKSPPRPRDRAPRCSLRRVRSKRDVYPAFCLPRNRYRLKLRGGKWPRPTCS